MAYESWATLVEENRALRARLRNRGRELLLERDRRNAIRHDLETLQQYCKRLENLP